MSEKNRLANSARWAKIDKEERSKIMKELALNRWKKISKEERHVIAMKLVESRK